MPRVDDDAEESVRTFLLSGLPKGYVTRGGKNFGVWLGSTIFTLCNSKYRMYHPRLGLYCPQPPQKQAGIHFHPV